MYGYKAGMSKPIDVEPFIFPRWILESFIGLTPAEIAEVDRLTGDSDSSQPAD
jgi:hypothetical protein